MSSRVKALALVGVLALLTAAFVLGSGSPRDREPPARSDSELVQLRAAAALTPCPTGLGPALPDVTARCLGGGAPVRLRNQPALPTVLNVWGSWCGPCREEVPDLQAFSARAAGRVAVVGVDTADTDRSALSFAAFVGMTYPSIVDEDGVISATFGPGVPKTVLLDAAGTVKHVKAGKLDSEQELTELVRTHLGVAV